ncbi:MAG: AAA family ATPase [Lachnospiraceae bacterium]|nr:AAA family ATPase [Lachnospiraceae bacterium]
MGYTFKQLCLKNFKYITDERPLEFQFDNRNIVILDGQNGYGKTTLFDAIEILLTGKIKHFNEALQNRGLENLGTLANDINKDITISAILLSDEADELKIERRLLCGRNFESEISLNGEKAEQDDLYGKLKFSLNMFDIGTYISQSESLNFLQNKYKERKACVTSLSENFELESKIQKLKQLQDFLEQRVSSETSQKEKEITDIEEKIVSIQNQVNNISLNLELPGEDVRLFEEKDYPFDVIKLDDSIIYEAVAAPLRQIRNFVEHYEEYMKYMNNATLSELENISKNTYMALFYKKEIELLNSNEELLQKLVRCRQLLKNYNDYKWSIDEELFEKAAVDKGTVLQLIQLLANQQTQRSQLEEADKALEQMTTVRRAFISQYNDVVDAGKFEKDVCPLCGTRRNDIQQAIAETEKFIKNIHTEDVKKIDDTEKEITNTFLAEIVPKLRQFLKLNEHLLQIYNSLAECRTLSTDNLQTMLDKVGLAELMTQRKEEFDINDFLQQYEIMAMEIHKIAQPVQIDFGKEQIDLYKSIHSTYYHDKKPKHSVEQLRSKEQYIAKLFNDKLLMQLSAETEKVEKLKERYEEYCVKKNNMTETIKVLVSKYDAANKDYQTQLANAIKIPLLVYSGRIIQNYPLGLGIKAVVRTNQLVFEADSKSGNDVYNILSTGQLNGLSIAFLLAIKNVYGRTDGLDILLIDDPLQTIDDISAISLADLLTQQDIGQIVLSTHEDGKAALLKYKFIRAGLTVKEQDMQQQYMSVVLNSDRLSVG